ncbi:type III-B CRISPR module RAMP protein Cmr1 [Micromonospora musae]|uniref:Type III-B CRISPR module RAMP protein Cmr1 n=1 Tax=Micromonospora musae TaxID=1894970 RepID=A0A3A9Y976_9ACTN|nr:type III-B CRISPR module RAMP protein Cmr1 [Micromonospora musae]RKN33829.1 type III-B CRISPR module RAMP protein Cmr1 [Micromonospora musae]
MAWTTLTMQVTTPLFNGGHQPAPSESTEGGNSRSARNLDADAGIRVSSLRGAMRYWLRAIAGAEVGNQIHVLAALESRVFGSTTRASSVAMRVPKPPPVSRNSQPDWCKRDDARWIGYLAGQGLSKPAGRGCQLTRPFVAPGTTFDLQLRLPRDDDTAALVMAALWSLCRYGGLGARTRRGFGGLRVIAVEGHLPTPWTTERLCAAAVVSGDGLDSDEQGRPPEIAACAPALARIAALARQDVGEAAPEGWADLPTYPVFGGPDIFIAGLSARTFGDWPAVLGFAGEQYRWFRATEPAPGAPYHPPIKTREWLHTVRGNDRRFALGALGLPVNFKDGNIVQPEKTAAAAGGKAPLRRASPLWLRPVQDGDNGWRLLSFAFLGRFLPDGEAEVFLRGPQSKKLDVSVADVRELSTNWITTLSRGDSFVRAATR